MAKASVSVGLDIDEECARGVVLKRGLRGAHVLVHAGEWPLPRDAEERETALRDALAMLKAKAGTTSPSAWFDTIQGGSVSLRLIHIPPVPRHEVKGAVMWEARTQVPFPLDRAFSDHSVMGEVARADGAAPQVVVMLGAAAEEAVLRHIHPLEAAGIRLSGLAPTAAALWSARNRLADLTPGEPYALVHVGGRTATICVGKGDMLSFTREITLPGGPIITDDGGPGEPSAVVRELRRTLHHYRERHRGETVATVVLSGTVACTGGVAEVLAPALGCTVRIADPLARLGVPGSARPVAERSPAFAVATAAAIGGSGINLLPPSLRPRTRRPLAHVLVPVAAVVVLAAGSYQWSLTTTEPALRALVERTEAELERARTRDEQVLRLKGRQARLERLAQVLPRVSGERIEWQEMFRTLSRSLPANVALRSLSIEGTESAERSGEKPALKASLKAVAFGAEAEALAALAAVIEAIQATGSFSGVRVSAPMRKSKDYTKPAAEFGLSFDIVSGRPDAVRRAGAAGS